MAALSALIKILMEGKYALPLSCLVGLGVYFGLKRSLWEAGLASFIGFLGLGGLKPTLLALKTLPRDMRYAITYTNAILS